MASGPLGRGAYLAAAPGAVSLAAQGALGLPASPRSLKGLPEHCAAGCTLASGVSPWACDVTCNVTMGVCVVYLEVWDRLGGWELSGVPMGNPVLSLALSHPEREG